MPTNVEIKASVSDLPALKKQVEKISDAPGEEIHQDDTFFSVPHGRLKLRVFSANSGELIYYKRGDTLDPKPSHYLISKTSDPVSLRAVLAASLDTVGQVRKRRTLFMVGNTRVHLDEVEDLGTYIELEVVLNKDTSTKDGKEIALALMNKLHIDPANLVKGAYIDMINAAKSPRSDQ